MSRFRITTITNSDNEKNNNDNNKKKLYCCIKDTSIKIPTTMITIREHYIGILGLIIPSYDIIYMKYTTNEDIAEK